MHASMHDENTDAPMTLQPIQPLNSSRKRGDIDEDPYNLMSTKEHCMPEFTEDDGESAATEAELLNGMEQFNDEEIEDRLGELDEDCYFPQDGYDYSKHLKKINEKAMLVASHENEPAEKFVMTREERETIEAIEAVGMNDDAGYEELDDDFFAELGAEGCDDVDMWGEKGAELAQLNRMQEQRQALYADTEVSVPQADPRFERIMESYGDDDIGDLEDEDVHGQLNLDDIEDILDDYLDGKVEEAEENLQQLFGKNEEVVDRLSPEENMAFLDLLDELPDLCDEEISYGHRSMWDCETILSTKSNISNHPGKIVLEKRKAKIRKPKMDEIVEEEEEIIALPEVQLTRPDGETAEEKRIRKNAVKERQRLCRQMKKEKTLLIRAEDLKLRSREVGRGDVRFKARVVPL